MFTILFALRSNVRMQVMTWPFLKQSVRLQQLPPTWHSQSITRSLFSMLVSNHVSNMSSRCSLILGFSSIGPIREFLSRPQMSFPHSVKQNTRQRDHLQKIICINFDRQTWSWLFVKSKVLTDAFFIPSYARQILASLAFTSYATTISIARS